MRGLHIVYSINFHDLLQCMMAGKKIFLRIFIPEQGLELYDGIDLSRLLGDYFLQPEGVHDYYCSGIMCSSI